MNDRSGGYSWRKLNQCMRLFFLIRWMCSLLSWILEYIRILRTDTDISVSYGYISVNINILYVPRVSIWAGQLNKRRRLCLAKTSHVYPLHWHWDVPKISRSLIGTNSDLTTKMFPLICMAVCPAESGRSIVKSEMTILSQTAHHSKLNPCFSSVHVLYFSAEFLSGNDIATLCTAGISISLQNF